MKTVKIHIVTPDGPVVETEADMVIAMTETGELGILPGHIATVAPLQIGGLRIKKGNDTKIIAVHGGFIEIRPEIITVLAQSAETAETIDLARAKHAAKRAEIALQAKKDEASFLSAELQLKRAINRINAAENRF
ncbi:F0F1 ATP synthase subunit epsilon [Sporosarcina sp. 6E9]|uniref:F0F1 ATP synthase subunit epsilon n=1 Tax=Sporosarcina sp. 6E9 TaxID=2819235 RepID=UPI001B30AF04|nr:F0F1 ATP synthase subunit epsilon [Sporosarcina sp. 6E9]